MIYIGKKDCVFTKASDNIAGLGFRSTSTERYFPIVTLSTNDDIKCLENLKKELKIKISLNRQRSEKNATKNNIDYMIDSSSTDISRLFLNSFNIGEKEPTKDSWC